MNSIASRPIDRLALAYISARCRICGGTYIDGVQGISGYLNCDRKTASQSLRRLCEAGAIVSAGSLGRVETYMINGETAPAGDAPRAIHHGQIPPIDGEKPPIGEADGTGAEEEIRPIDGENLRIAASIEGYSHGRRIPINGANLPIDGQGEPINGEKPPIDGENLRIRPHMDGLKDGLKYIHPSDPSTGYAPQVASEAEIATALARLKGLTENPNRLRQAEAPYRAL
ncbi:MAG: hypothetical protein E7001_07955, partial [Coriobacteriaceae bacterium]|nr:hypothetical protein [Coriobacteriaceae bacterium]